MVLANKRIEGELIGTLRSLSGNSELTDKGLYTLAEIVQIIGKDKLSGFLTKARELQKKIIGIDGELGVYNGLFVLKQGMEVMYHGTELANQYKQEKNKPLNEESNEKSSRSSANPTLSLGRKYTLLSDPMISTQTGHVHIRVKDDRGEEISSSYRFYHVPSKD